MYPWKQVAKKMMIFMEFIDSINNNNNNKMEHTTIGLLPFHHHRLPHRYGRRLHLGTISVESLKFLQSTVTKHQILSSFCINVVVSHMTSLHRIC
jgi:hypothetical protein